MIEIGKEDVMALAKAAEHLPSRRNGQKPATSTLYRWTSNGVKGIKLEYLQVGSTRCTSIEALQRFFGRLTAEGGSLDDDPLLANDSQRIREKLDAAGF